ncbi:MAG: RHS repeat-associated core domain-containing protein, partial [Pyrinomonadaceae bacterium]
GRPLVTTLPDGNTRETTYGGCGCAGGEVVTSRDERGRRRRATMDVLGRLKQVEELNWDTSVYSTTNYAYNAGDELTQINQAGQIRTLEYDGFGRLWRRTTPEQGATTYSYFADETVQTLTDARGATTTFAYNARQQPTSITYGVPAGVAATPNVSFGYDAAGNRTSMTDGMGSMSYAYDQLSRVTSETRTFSGAGSFTLGYSYNLTGELTGITNPWNAQVGYTYDATGRATSVSGANYAGVSSYVNSISYRAFGLKQMAYGNGRTLSVNYDNRLRPTNYDVPGVLRLQYEYGWENTDRVGFVRNIDDQTLDRWYAYDHVGRLICSRSGTEARIGFGEQIPVAYDGPYSHGYSYDVWGNRTHIEGWGGVARWADYTYTNNRRNGMQYDAAGNITNDGGHNFSYDAVGQQASASNGTYVLQQDYDGDGLRAKKVDAGDTIYYLRSSVLGGQVVAEIYGGGVSYAGSGWWLRGYVYLGSQMVATQAGGVNWVHQDPVGKSQRITDSSGNINATIELDPFGGDTARSNGNSAFQPHRFTSYERDGLGSDDAMFRRYNRWWATFDQPDPYDGSYDLTDPQSLNRYAYVQNDPVNFVDPTGLMSCGAEFSYSDCGGGGGFWGGGGGFGGHVAERNQLYGGLTPNVVAGMRVHNERLGNAVAGNGYMTNVELTRDFQIRYGYNPDGSLWTDFSISVEIAGHTPWHEWGILRPIGDFSRGVANRVTGGWVNRVHESRGEPTPNSTAYDLGSNSGDVFLVLATRGRNRSGPVPGAVVPHSTLKFGPNGNITGYTTFRLNPRNPTGFDVFKRFDGTGRSHFNKVTGRDVPTPHIQGPRIPGGVRPARPGEGPR